MQGQEVGSSAFCGSKIKCVCLDLGGMGTMLTVRPHPLLLYNALLPLITPFPDARRATPHAFTTELPRLALIVILLPAHGASVTGQSRNCLLLFAVEISFRPASLDTTIYQPIPHSNSPPFSHSPTWPGKLLRLSLARKLANNFAIKMRAQKSLEIQFVTVCC